MIYSDAATNTMWNNDQEYATPSSSLSQTLSLPFPSEFGRESASSNRAVNTGFSQMGWTQKEKDEMFFGFCFVSE